MGHGCSTEAGYWERGDRMVVKIFREMKVRRNNECSEYTTIKNVKSKTGGGRAIDFEGSGNGVVVGSNLGLFCAGIFVLLPGSAVRLCFVFSRFLLFALCI